MIRLNRSLVRGLTLRWPRPVAVLVAGLVGTVAPALFALLTTIPRPAVHDEFSYLLGADTFAHFRLTNPTPQFPEFFESPHILVTPTYASKYPPGQALVMAVGQVLTGYPIAGVWLSCGLFAAALCWMLQAWTSRPFALATTAVAIATLGLSTYWAQSYWGGMVAASGGALLFGGLRRVVRRPRVSSSVLMALGVIVLANSRPFEGVLVCLAISPLLLRWLITLRTEARTLAIRTWMRPFVLVLIIGAALMTVYNHAVTRSWGKTPYTVHSNQYFGQGFFLFSGQQPPELHPSSRVKDFYALYQGPADRPLRMLSRGVRYFLNRLPATIETALGVTSGLRGNSRAEYRSILLWILVLALATQMRSRWLWFSVATIVAVVFAQSLVSWWYAHYAAPLVPLVLACMAMALRPVTSVGGRWSRFVPLTVVALAAGFALMTLTWARLDGPNRGGIEVTGPNTYPNLVTERAQVMRQLDREPGSHLVFVSYDPAYSIQLEWVYNPAVFSAAKTLFAHHLGLEKNKQLIAAHPERSIWMVRVSPDRSTLERYGSR